MSNTDVKRSGLMENWPTLAVAALGAFLVIMDVTVVAVALPSIERDLNSSFAELQWIINAYNIAYTSVLVAVGALADRIGRRRTMVTGLALFGLMSLIVGLANSPTALIWGRLAQGLSASAMLILGVALISHAFQGADRAKAFAFWGVSIGVAAAFGPMIGGVLVDFLSWRWIFLINIPLVAILIALCYWRVEESLDPNPGKFDWPGIASFTAAFALLSFAVIEGGELGWNSTPIVSSFIASAALFLLFVWIGLRSKNPAFDLGLFRIPTFTGAQLLCMLSSVTFWVMLVYLPLYFQVMRGMSPWAAGLMLLPLTVPLLLLAPLGAKLAAPSSLGVRGLMILGCLLPAIGFVWLAVAPPESIALWVVAFLIIGIGTGLINGELANVATAVVPPERAGLASGINITFRHGSFTLAISLVGAILLASVTAQLAAAPVAAALSDLPRTANLIALGDFSSAVSGAPAGAQEALTQFGRASFENAFSLIMGIVALLAVLAVICAVFMIRRSDLPTAEPVTSSS